MPTVFWFIIHSFQTDYLKKMSVISVPCVHSKKLHRFHVSYNMNPKTERKCVCNINNHAT